MTAQSFTSAASVSDRRHIDDRLHTRSVRACGRLLLIRGTLSVLLGLVALFWPISSLVGFVLGFGVMALLDGLIALATGFRRIFRHVHPGWLLVARGSGGLFVGAVFLAYPLFGSLASSLTAISLAVAWALVVGATEVAAGVRLYRATHQWHLIGAGVCLFLFGAFLSACFFTAPLATIVGLVWTLGTWAIASGILLLVGAFRLFKLGRT